ncbi:response regulator transcription factor [Bombilactobacillus folatiphilus]|uniref:Response regulator transcription factor n=1 Tax=Bombilactobacillus folatiphilus TaxID=2923362 RepID=A0ABY4PAM4_9LACO|nr:response regulator transcription factor [Bombilactobacillus folatiphilus]UQS82657.1 response regulator transcription factor [Bombilactobacillus folatiphilus]
MAKIIIVDDDQLVTQALTTIIQTDSTLTVPACGHTVQDAINLSKQYCPDVLLLDIRMPDGLGLQAAQSIFKKNEQAKILLLTTFSDDEYINEALAIGIQGYLIKQNFQAIVPAIHAVLNQQYVYGDEIIHKMQAQLTNQAPYHTTTNLTDREQDILQLVAHGQNNKEIAQTLFLSVGTVRNLISQLLLKLELRDRTQLAIFYYQHH